ncbi:MAG: hypothetical protein HOK65_15150 [Crocinitomicaceae bacterium]|jgi:hypothetical protein|nr:hypothetical protein [Crocinitomicaceae bacterium]
MSKLSRREFKELLKEWNDNFINENSNEEKNLSDFFDFAKSKLPFIVTILNQATFITENLELFTEDGNHRLGIFRRILSNLNKEINEEKGIPAIILYEGEKDYEDRLKESGYSFIEFSEQIKKRTSKESKDVIGRFIEKGYKVKFCESLKIKDFSKKGANSPGPIINDYIQSLYDEFIKVKGEKKKFDTSNLISKAPTFDDDEEDEEEFNLVL